MKLLYFIYWMRECASNSILFRQIWIVLAVTLLSNCAHKPDVSVLEPGYARADKSHSQEDGLNAAAEQGSSDELAEESLPTMDLDAKLLEELILADLASYSEQWGIASEKAQSAASKTRDYRIARLASLYAMRDQDYQAAVGSARLWLELLPEDGDAQVTLILAYMGVNDGDAAIKIFDQRQKDQAIDEFIREVGGILVRQDSAEPALHIVNHYVDLYPDSAQVALSAAYVSQTFKDDERTERWLESALALRPEWGLAAQMKSNLLLRQGKSEERSQYIKEFIDKYPKADTMRINYAADLAKQEKFQAALDQMRTVIANDKRNVSALSYAAALAEQVGEKEQAKLYYRKAISLDPNNEEARWALARQAIQRKDYKSAEQHYQKIVSEGAYFRAQLQVANMRYYTRGIESAINSLRGLQPTTEAEYVNRATTRHYLLLQDHRYEEAYSAINETIAFLPNNLELIYARALVAAELNDIQTAENDLRQILQQIPDHANALNALGYTLADQTSRYQEAKELIEKALVLKPNEAHILDSMGWVLYRLKDYENALEYLQQAYDQTSEGEVAAHLGEVLWESGDQARAKELWKRALDEDKKKSFIVKYFGSI